MKSKLFAILLLAGSSLFARTNVVVGAGFGGGYYAPPRHECGWPHLPAAVSGSGVRLDQRLLGSVGPALRLDGGLLGAPPVCACALAGAALLRRPLLSRLLAPVIALGNCGRGGRFYGTGSESVRASDWSSLTGRFRQDGEARRSKIQRYYKASRLPHNTIVSAPKVSKCQPIPKAFALVFCSAPSSAPTPRTMNSAAARSTRWSCTTTR